MCLQNEWIFGGKMHVLFFGVDIAAKANEFNRLRVGTSKKIYFCIYVIYSSSNGVSPTVWCLINSLFSIISQDTFFMHGVLRNFYNSLGIMIYL